MGGGGSPSGSNLPSLVDVKKSTAEEVCSRAVAVTYIPYSSNHWSEPLNEDRAKVVIEAFLCPKDGHGQCRAF